MQGLRQLVKNCALNLSREIFKKVEVEWNAQGLNWLKNWSNMENEKKNQIVFIIHSQDIHNKYNSL